MILLLLPPLALAGVHADHAAQWGSAPAAWAGTLPAAAPVALAPPPPGVRRATVYGYHPYWGSDPTELDFDRLTHLAIFNVDVNSDGTLSGTSNWTSVAGAVVPLAHAHGVKVHLCVTSFSSSIHSSVLPSASRRATLIAALKSQVDAYGADGVNVDFEGLSSSNRDSFSTFIEELAAQVGDVYIATPAVDWSGAFDYDRLAAASQGLFIMGYGYHWSGGNPGPNDPLYGGGAWGQYALDWTIADYLYYDAPPDKIVLGLPLYGQEWPAGSTVPGTSQGTAWSVTMDEAVQIAAAEGRQYDTTTWSPYVIRSSTQLWYDDPASVQDRIHYAVTDEGLQGVGFWALTYEGDDPAFWDMVEDETVEPLAGDSGDSGSGDNGGDSGSGGNGGDSGSGDNGSDSGPDDAQADVEHGEATGGCATAPTRPFGAALVVAALLLRRRR